MAGDVGRRVRAKPHHNLGRLLRAPDAPEWDPSRIVGLNRLLAGRVATRRALEHTFKHWGSERARYQGVHPNGLRRILLGRRLG